MPKRAKSTTMSGSPACTPSLELPGTIAPNPIPSPDFPDGRFPIVGIGASAGGLKAFERFFSAKSAETEPGMAFVLVQHLAPEHKSILTELVKRFTRMARLKP